ncbi:MAG TPA: hypothetical protein VK654_10550 [Nitrospirota bacterium]|nr:hypothetical protein [Nitrospirota bacterium]
MGTNDMKQAVTQALEVSDFEKVLTLALAERRILSVLIRLAYHKDTLLGWRAITAIGKIATVYLRSNADYLRETARKLLWSLTDESGGIGWSAPEILGEIVSADPVKFSDFVPLIAEVFSIEEKVFRPGVLYALKRIAETSPEAVACYHELVWEGLADENPLARAYALLLLPRIKWIAKTSDQDEIGQRVNRLLNDYSEVWIYENDNFNGMLIKDIAKSIVV